MSSTPTRTFPAGFLRGAKASCQAEGAVGEGGPFRRCAETIAANEL